MTRFYKKLKSDGTIDMIGTSSEPVTDGTEITESEYDELHSEIILNAVHIVIESEDVVE